MYRSSGTVWVIDMSDMQTVKQALTASAAYAKQYLGEPLEAHEEFSGRAGASWLLYAINDFQKKLEE